MPDREVPVEAPVPQAATRGSSILSITMSQEVDFFGMAYSLLCSHEHTQYACAHHTILGV